MDAEDKFDPIEEIVQQQKNSPVVGRMRRLCQTIVVNAVGYPLHSDYDIKVSTFIAKHVQALKESASSAVRDIDAGDELTFLRVKTRKNEIIIANEKEFAIIAVRKEGHTWYQFEEFLWTIPMMDGWVWTD